MTICATRRNAPFIRAMKARYGSTDGAAKRRCAEELRVNVSTVKRWVADTVPAPYSAVLALELMGARDA